MPPSLAVALAWLILAVIVLFALKTAFSALLAAWRRAHSPYSPKGPVLSSPERQLYSRLVSALPGHIVLAQVAFSRLVEARNGTPKQNRVRMNAVLQKVADFVVCTEDFEVVAVIELDDSTHDPEKDARRDAILEAAGIETVRFHVSRLPNEDEIRDALE